MSEHDSSPNGCHCNVPEHAQLRATLQAVVDCYQDEGCDGCGTIGADVYERAAALVNGAHTKPAAGEMGIPYGQVGHVPQVLARVVVDRGHDFEAVKQFLLHGFDEDAFWDRFAGPAADFIEDEFTKV